MLIPFFATAVAAQQVPWVCGTPSPTNPTPTDLTDFGDPVARSATKRVPVVFHVMLEDDGTGDLADYWIDTWITSTNNAFASYNFSFDLVGIDRVKNSSVRGSGRSASSLYRFDPEHVLNVYVGDYFGGGFVYGDVLTNPAPSHDGIYLNYPVAPRHFTDRNVTLPHEAGHYFNLLHTWEGGCADAGNCLANGDMICDTPPDTHAYSDDPLDYSAPFPVTCAIDSCPNEPGNDPNWNFMDYGWAECVTSFTDQQLHRAQSAYYDYRNLDVPLVISSTLVLNADRSFTLRDELLAFSAGEGIRVETGGALSIAGAARLDGNLTVEAGGGLSFLAGGDLTIENGAQITFEEDLIVPWGSRLELDPGVTLAFAPGKRLIVRGEFDADNATLTALDPQQGWGGVRLEVATGRPEAIFQNRSIVEQVNASASIYVSGGDLTVNRSQIVGRNMGSSDGIYATLGVDGADTHYWANIVVQNESLVRDHGRHGIYAYTYADVTVEGFRTKVFNNGNTGVHAYGSTASAYVGSKAEVKSNRYGIVARYGATVVTSKPGQSAPVPFYPNITVTGQDDATLYAYQTGYIEAGLGANSPSAYNDFEAAGEDHARARFNASVVATYNWWGQASGPLASKVDEAQGGTFVGCPYLTAESKNSTFTFCNGEGRVADGTSGSVGPNGSVSRDGEGGPLDAARLALEAEEYPAAVDFLGAAMDAASESEADEAERLLAFSMVPRLIRAASGKDEASAASALALLDARSGPEHPDRLVALETLVSAHLALGAADAALATADDLLAASGADPAAQLIRAHALLVLGRAEEAEAVVAAVLATAEGDVADQAVALAEDLALRDGSEFAGERRSSEAAESAVLRAAPALFAIRAPYPNPVGASNGSIVLPVELPEEAEVMVEVVDLLGRRMQLVPAATYGAGAHALTLDVSALAPGTYVARVAAGARGGSAKFVVAE